MRRAESSVSGLRGRADVLVLLMVFGLLFVMLITGMILLSSRRARSARAMVRQQAVIAAGEMKAAEISQVAERPGAPFASGDAPPASMLTEEGSKAAAPTTVPKSTDTAEVKEKVDGAMATGLAYLAKSINEDGSFGPLPPGAKEGDVGITALAVWTWASCPEGLRKRHEGVFGKGLEFLLAHQQEDGSILNVGQGLNTYKTATAILALQAANPEAHKGAIERARGYLVGLQVTEEDGVERSSPYYGSWGYKKGQPSGNLSTTAFALDALRQSGLDENDEAYKRVLVFLQRCQNRSESNDFTDGVEVGNDGGFRYDAGLRKEMSSPREGADGKTFYPSYASMTYAGLKSLIHARLTKDDPRVQAAIGWIREHYTLEENFGMGTRDDPGRAKQGLYYYYLTFARALDAYGEKVIRGSTDVDHDWAEDLARKLVSLQREDGSWVNEEDRWWESNPILVTAYSVSALAVARRNLD